ncbi:cysteine proteinase [Agrocybe pediades]|nr:cysteine proteinase [Agrocybe pediades]
MEIDQQLQQQQLDTDPSPSHPDTNANAKQQPTSHDLVGGPFAVIESDPGVFTSLTRSLGIHGLELVEMYDIEPWAVDHLKPHGLIFCFMWHKDTHRPTDFNDPAAERVWFANQLSDDACATHAILNVLLNCPHIDVGEEMRAFKRDTEGMSPVMRGLAVTNSPIIRPAHNSLARPSDIRASINNLTITTLNADKKRKAADKKKASQTESSSKSKPPPAKRAKVSAKGKGKDSTAKGTAGRPKRRRKPKDEDEDDNEEDKEEEEGGGEETEHEGEAEAEPPQQEETYHFIGYVPAYGKVWELDGLKSGPLEVGELPSSKADGNSNDPGESSTEGWMDVVRPALRMKMEKYGGSGNDGSNIRFSLLAIVDDLYRKASDELEFLRRDRIALERRLAELDGEWEAKVDASLRAAAETAFTIPNHESNKVYANDFASRRMTRDLEIMNMPVSSCIPSWEACIRDAMRAKVAVEDELAKADRAKVDHEKRTFDYEPFIREYVQSLHREGLLNALLDRDSDGKKKRGRKKAAAKG